MSTQPYHSVQEKQSLSVFDTSKPIQETRDYAKFRFSEANRAIDDRHLARLIEAIDKHNVLHRYPIKVNKELIVLDGQHRLKAAEALRVPIYYEVVDDISIGDVASLNNLTLRWKAADYLNFWCARGVPDYKAARDFLRTYPWIGLSMVIKTAMTTTSTTASPRVTFQQHWTAGTWRWQYAAYMRDIALHVAELKHYPLFWKQEKFQMALGMLLTSPDYKPERMIRQLDKISTRLVRCVTAGDYVSVLTDIYNYGYQSDNRVEFDHWWKNVDNTVIRDLRRRYMTKF